MLPVSLIKIQKGMPPSHSLESIPFFQVSLICAYILQHT
ncbi:hypothetical protein KNP414_04299 [Paenibacillus mucilaginosus KNP414]|uniref:Uncharacterized protein n=1 Tax=Paenibacillus mucilaginosus (strain KNP414) TaxID=1036673 RepID=F8FJI1_PAEMK|nr:hypothetical protein KNP414_04299 [Paenibacillus mucilaginosus KNP414]